MLDPRLIMTSSDRLSEDLKKPGSAPKSDERIVGEQAMPLPSDLRSGGTRPGHDQPHRCLQNS